MAIQLFDFNANTRITISQGIQLDQSGPIMLNSVQSKFIMNPGNTHTINVAGVLDGTTLNFWNASASISGTLVDQNGNPVPECTNVPIPYVPNTNGIFQASFGDFNFQPIEGTQYTLIIDGIQNGVTLHVEALVEVAVRSS